MKRITLLLIFGFTFATVINIPGDFPIIQHGIDASMDGDTVLVQPGTYYENINFNGHNITLASMFIITGDTSLISQTVIDGNQNGSVVIFDNYEDNTAILNGFILQNGSGNENYLGTLYGGGIRCNSSDPKLMNLKIINNTADYGGGISCNFSDPILVNILISNNSVAGGGGGMENYSSNPSLTDITISYNTAVEYGGGMANDFASPTLTNCIFHNNTSLENVGGGMSNYTTSSPILINCTFYNNSAVTGGGLWNGGATATVTNSIFWADSPDEFYGNISEVNYSNIQGGYEGSANMESDPLFLDPDNDDYHLQANSPCIDAGDPNSALDPDGTISDMGTYYFDQSGDCPVQGDVSGDGNLDVIDIVQTVECILSYTGDCICADLDANGTIDVIDIVLMVELILGGN